MHNISMEKMLSNSDMEKVKKFPLGEFLGFIISDTKCMILDMSKAMEKCENHSTFFKIKHLKPLLLIIYHFT